MFYPGDVLKVLLGGGATALAIYSYIPYARDILRGRTKPHAFSWLIWGTMTGIGFAAQVSENGGPGTWAMGLTTVACLLFFVAALFRGEKNITRTDWICLLGAALSIVFWLVTDGPLLSVVLITLIDALGFVPTFRKSYYKPFEETLSTYLLSAIKFVMVIFALETFNLITVLYPLSLVIANGAFITMLYVRRKQVANPAAEPQPLQAI